MTLPLASRIALVTGASRGIGYATARALARAGAHVVAVARTQGGLEELDDEIRKDGGSATLVPLNLTDFDGIARLGAALHERHGKLDILVGNAGMLGILSPLGHIDPKEWDKVFAAVKRCHEVVHEMGAPRVSTVIKLGTRTDRAQTLDDKIKSVEAKLAAH